jgi:hypothetical protein
MSNCDSVPALLQILSTWAEAKRVEQFFADAHCLHPNGLICVQAVIGRPAHMGRRQPTALSPAHRRQDPATTRHTTSSDDCRKADIVSGERALLDNSVR